MSNRLIAIAALTLVSASFATPVLAGSHLSKFMSSSPMLATQVMCQPPNMIVRVCTVGGFGSPCQHFEYRCTAPSKIN